MTKESPELSDRELATLLLLSRGLRRTAIAKQMELSDACLFAAGHEEA